MPSARAPEGHLLEPDSSELNDSFIHFFSKCLRGTSWVPRPRLAYKLGEPYLEAWPLGCMGAPPPPSPGLRAPFPPSPHPLWALQSSSPGGWGRGSLEEEPPADPPQRSPRGGDSLSGVEVGLRSPARAPHRRLFPEWGF